MLRVIGYPLMVLWRVPGFVVRVIGDALRVVGSIMMLLLLAPMVLFSVALGRWSASSHYGRAVGNEVAGGLLAVYRVLLGHLLWLFKLTPLTDAIEHRLPQVVRMAPGADTPKRSTGTFDGYTIVGSLSSGGSGSKLYIAEPSEEKHEQFRRDGHEGVAEVVIKTFNLNDGSSLPQIVRESRALDAAKRLDLVLEHSLSDDRFFYIMRYVPGENLTEATQSLHARCGPSGLEGQSLRSGLSYVADLLRTLDGYHRGGLWHKDVKPDNIIVSRDRAHLVDLGLVTPLRSAMTLTTHGTEYFRDPEMVRMALRGVKVHEVDGARFDVFAAGAVMYSIIENSFPAHGGLSNISKRAPDTVRWIVRRAMADYDKRYTSAAEMLADVRALLAAKDPFAVKPRDLPSVSGDAVDSKPGPVEVVMPDVPPQAPRRAGAAMPPRGDVGRVAGLGARPNGAGRARTPRTARGRMLPAIGVVNWWTGAYKVQSVAEAMPAADGPVAVDREARTVRVGPVQIGLARGEREKPRVAQAVDGPSSRVVPPEQRRSSREQRAAARARVVSAQRRASKHRASAQSRAAKSGLRQHERGMSTAMFIALAGMALVGGVVYKGLTRTGGQQQVAMADAAIDAPHQKNEPASSMLPEVPFEHFEILRAPERDLAAAASSAMLTAGVLPTLNDPANSARLAAGVGSAGVAAIRGMLASGTFLVINEPTVRDVDGHAESIAGAVQRLYTAGFDIAGHPGDTSIDRDQLEDLVAQVHTARSLRPLSSRGVERDLAAWLSDEARFDWILWIERDASETNQLGMYVFNAAPKQGATVLDRALPAAQRAFAEAVVFDPAVGS